MNEGHKKTNNDSFKPDSIEWWRLGVDVLKWIVSGSVLIIGFFMIRPHEQERLDKALQLEVYKAYLSASDTTNIELWQRKLNLMKAFTAENDHKINRFIDKEQARIDDINKSKDALASVKDEYDKVKSERDKLEATGYMDKRRLSKANRTIDELDSKLKALDAQKKTYTEKLTSYGVVNAIVTLPSAGLKVGADSLSGPSTNTGKQQNTDTHNGSVPLTGEGSHTGVGP
ncbi:hypothetical protein [Geomonas azotofigens]|uniref:hypothetical protein n=1 Tax=Geomonas azotofigens TaxID=2843196 RepID=UPI001C0FBE99|nr:hypothetical protein [Geomonas azotofigens]MBU5612179.1 hypothetical protein [Geomonas azotofigens]